MENLEDGLKKMGKHIESISNDDSEREYAVPGYKDVPVLIPYSHLENAQGRCNALEQLLRKDTPNEIILAFIEKARSDGRWK